MHLKYLSQDEGLAVNVSYGQNLLHSEQLKGNFKTGLSFSESIEINLYFTYQVYEL